MSSGEEHAWPTITTTRASGYPSPSLLAYPTLGVASGQKVARPLLAGRGGARPRVGVCGRWDGARHWFIRTMRGADTTIDVDKPVSSLVQDGPFRYSRNPGYLSLAMIYAGIFILRNALWAILLLPLLLLLTQRELIEREERYLDEREERYLERTFGEEYLAYKRRMRRWV